MLEVCLAILTTLISYGANSNAERIPVLATPVYDHTYLVLTRSDDTRLLESCTAYVNNSSFTESVNSSAARCVTRFTNFSLDEEFAKAYADEVARTIKHDLHARRAVNAALGLVALGGAIGIWSMQIPFTLIEPLDKAMVLILGAIPAIPGAISLLAAVFNQPARNLPTTSTYLASSDAVLVGTHQFVLVERALKHLEKSVHGNDALKKP